MSRLAIVLMLTSGAAWAKPWNGIDPGVATKEEVVAKFGPPSTTVTQEGREVLAYMKEKAIKGTVQAQFKIDAKTGKVERIDVFPAPKIDKAAIEGSYGPVCPAGPQPASPCYVKKVTDDFRTYFHYSKLGLAIFFKEDGDTVQSFIFQAVKK